MSAYENIFTRVQVWPGKPDLGVAGDRIEREKAPCSSTGSASSATRNSVRFISAVSASCR